MIATRIQIINTILFLAKSNADRAEAVIEKKEAGLPLSLKERNILSNFQYDQEMYSNLIRKYAQ
jgi:hypothetical protein